jgi:hypothetical protein
VRSRGALVAATAVLFAACLIWPSLIDPYIPIGRSVVLVPVLFFLAGMAIFACRDLVRPGLAAVVLPAGAACFASGHAFVVLAYLAIGALTLWVGCTPLLTSMSERLRGEDYSYGVYLYGFPVAQGFAALWPRANPYELFLVSMTVILPCAIASWRIVEHPAQRLGKIIDRWLSERPLDIGALGRAGRGMWRGVAIPCAVLLVAAFGLGTIETLAAIRPSRLLDVSIVSYGPVSIRAGASFNLQKDGSSALWLVLGRPPESGMIVLANGNPLPTYVGNVLAATMPPALFAKPGRVEIRVEEIRDATRLQSPPVFIDVR